MKPAVAKNNKLGDFAGKIGVPCCCLSMLRENVLLVLPCVRCRAVALDMKQHKFDKGPSGLNFHAVLCALNATLPEGLKT